MAASEEIRREEEFLKEVDPFRRNAFLLINKMVALASADVRALVDEILHSIFFLGRIQDPPFSLESILGDVLLTELKGDFPGPFDHCSSQLPRRSPFSCVLDMIVHLAGRQNETQIINDLRALLRDLKLDQSHELVSSTICVSHRTDVNNQVKYYGVSISASSRIPRKVMIAASCLSSWDRYVAGAVMTYFPTNEKNEDFDGTIQIPKRVRCQAFSLRENEDKLPCRSCGDLFGLTPCESTKAMWPYGNCAEVESLSNLFKNVADDKERARPTSRLMSSDEKRLTVEMSVRDELIDWLKQRQFKWNNTFYTPQ